MKDSPSKAKTKWRRIHCQLQKSNFQSLCSPLVYLLQVPGAGLRPTVTIINGFRSTLAIGSRSVPLQPKEGTAARTGWPNTACSIVTLGETGNPIIKTGISGWVIVRKAETQNWADSWPQPLPVLVQPEEAGGLGVAWLEAILLFWVPVFVFVSSGTCGRTNVSKAQGAGEMDLNTSAPHSIPCLSHRSGNSFVFQSACVLFPKLWCYFSANWET